MHSLSAANSALIRSLELEPGLRVADLGCGSGDPGLEIAQWVGPRGSVLGVDVSPRMLATASRRARLLGLENVRFRRADIARLRYSGRRFDRVASRFSLMFVDDVPQTLERMRGLLKRHGRAVIAVWGPIADNPGTRLRAEAVRPFEKNPPADPEQIAHPMRLARPGLLPRLMRGAGFVRVKVRPVRVCWVFPGLEGFVQMQVETTLAELYGSLSRADQQRLRRRLRRAFRRFESGAALRYPGLTWVATGLAP